MAPEVLTTTHIKFLLIGGASGVGKSTILKRIPIENKVNTGTLFKNRMAISSRDEIRSSNWSEFEGEVADDLAQFVIESLSSGKPVVIDTHFAAKLNGRRYRIGLKRNLIFELGRQVFDYALQNKKSLKVFVVLIGCNPHSLLRRRRLDKSRNRELFPSDCFNALRDNRVCSGQYLSELLRARTGLSDIDGLSIEYSIVENEDLDKAVSALHAILQIN